ncbi:hypothetical protein K466DRAFT_499555 [Polyporus arcularius HHB13444]|uniref:Ribosomal RNA methyltransferase FtsJ domain-containing protein n=1 Tax=Polyporus arcularius HHB13444 TaxID=1314778 RepID=A0A5C3P0M5_9APHY|nr:hypothetical protein K466DRAFT_499555 [Polyporus arcularius HHB13444]
MASLTQYPYTRPPPHPAHIDTTHRLGAVAILGRRSVPELQELVALRSKGWDDDHLDYYFKTLRKISDSPTKQAKQTWFKNMRNIMAELDSAANFVRSSTNITFLDVGCAPGGFSSYILQKVRSASGVGISLPEGMGGHPFLLENHLRSRYTHLQEDILRYDWSPVSPSGVSDRPRRRLRDTLIGHFPIVILDGHALRTYQDPSITTLDAEADLLKAAHGSYRDRLLIAQLIIALESVAPGGTIVTRLSHIECFPAAQLLYLLDSISDEVVLHKPQTMHTTRGTSYVIAKRVFCSKHASKREQYLLGLQALWSQLQQGGPHEGVGRMLVDGDLDFIVSAEAILESYVDRLVELGRQTWWTQAEGLRRLFNKRGIQ